MQTSAYGRLAAMTALHLLVMFALTYALVDALSHIHPNLNRGYMAVMMVAPMVLTMLWLMRSMYPHRRLNAAIAATALVAFALAFGFGRSQAFIGDAQFLRSMISHHSSAIVMCERSDIADPEILRLCADIVETQKREIAQMQRILGRQ